jgi:hypothetical protein
MNAKTYTLKNVRDFVDRLQRQLELGCGNHGCIIHSPKGMCTYSVCHCTPRDIANRLLVAAAELERMGGEWE